MKLDKYEAQAAGFFAVSAVAATFTIGYFVKNYREYKRITKDIEARKKAAVKKNDWITEQIMKEISRGRYDKRGINAIFTDWKYYAQVAPD